MAAKANLKLMAVAIMLILIGTGSAWGGGQSQCWLRK